MIVITDFYIQYKEEITMIQIIVGEKGKGKTIHLLQKANESVQNSSGNIIFLDKNYRHMYELNHKIRIINVSEFEMESYKEFLGFIYGIISQDNDISEIFIDGLLNLGQMTLEQTEFAISRIERITEKFNVNFTISISCNKEQLPGSAQKYIIISI
jgi:hypothetical protein